MEYAKETNDTGLRSFCTHVFYLFRTFLCFRFLLFVVVVAVVCYSWSCYSLIFFIFVHLLLLLLLLRLSVHIIFCLYDFVKKDNIRWTHRCTATAAASNLNFRITCGAYIYAHIRRIRMQRNTKASRAHLQSIHFYMY